MTQHPRDIDTGFTATLRRIEAARDIIEADLPRQDSEAYSLRQPFGVWVSGVFTLEDAVSEALDLTGDEVRAHPTLILANRYQQIIAIFYDGRAFVPNELVEPRSQNDR